MMPSKFSASFAAAALVLTVVASIDVHDGDIGLDRERIYSAVNMAPIYRGTINRIYKPLLESNEGLIEILRSGTTPGGTFSTSVAGRIRPVGTFSDLDGTLEYFFGIISAGPLRSKKVTISQYVVDPPYAFARIDVAGQNILNNLTSIAKFVGMWRFNDDGLVSGYDLELEDFDRVLGEFGFAYRNRSFIETLVVPRLCTEVQEFCTGENQQYTSFEECVAFNTGRKVDGFREGDSAACRSYHVRLAAFTPEIHCKHAGKGGGGKCVDKPYLQRFNDDVEVLGLPWDVRSPGPRFGNESMRNPEPYDAEM